MRGTSTHRSQSRSRRICWLQRMSLLSQHQRPRQPRRRSTSTSTSTSISTSTSASTSMGNTTTVTHRRGGHREGRRGVSAVARMPQRPQLRLHVRQRLLNKPTRRHCHGCPTLCRQSYQPPLPASTRQLSRTLRMRQAPVAAQAAQQVAGARGARCVVAITTTRTGERSRGTRRTRSTRSRRRSTSLARARSTSEARSTASTVTTTRVATATAQAAEATAIEAHRGSCAWGRSRMHNSPWARQWLGPLRRM